MKIVLDSPIKEALLEGGRVVLLSIVSGLIAYIPVLLANGQLSQEWAAGAGLLLVLLRMLDKYLHTVGKNEKDESLTKGLTRF